MYKFLLVLYLLFFFSHSSVYSGVDIPVDCWVPNKPEGYCFYCAAESIGRYYKIKNLYDFEAEDGTHWSLSGWYERWPSTGATDDDVYACLTNLKIKYDLYRNATLDWLKSMVDAEIPVIVSSSWSRTDKYHAYIVVDIEGDSIKILNSNNIQKYEYLSKKWFLEHWTNWALVIKP